MRGMGFVSSGQVATGSYQESRRRTLKLGLITSFLNRGVAALVPLVMVPLALGYIGVENYGAWTAAAAITGLAAFADFGIGNGLMTRLGELGDREDDLREKRRLVASGYALLCTIAFSLLCLLVLCSYLFDLAEILGAAGRASSETVELIIILTFGAVVLNMLAALVVRVQYGVGQQAVSNIWQAVGSGAGLVAAFAVSKSDAGSPMFVGAAVFAPPIIGLINTAVFFGISGVGRKLRGSFRDASVADTSQLLKLGVKFFLISVLLAVAVQLDPWIVARVAALEEVPTYVIPARIFATVGTIAVLMGTPLWPLHARAVAMGDVKWIRSVTFKLSIGFTFAVAGLSGVALLSAPWLMDVWLDNSVELDIHLWFALSVWWIVQTALGPFFMVQNGASVVRPQLIGYAAMVAVVVPLKFLAGLNGGLAAIVWVGTFGYLLLVAPACVVGYRRALELARANGEATGDTELDS